MAPDHWARRPCGEVCTVNRANLPSSTDPHEVIKYVSIGSVPGPGQINGMDEMEVQAAPSRAKRLVQDGDVLVGTVRPYLKSFVLLRDPPDNLVVSTGFAVLTPSKEMDPDFLYQVVCSPEFVAQLTSRMKGSSYPAVNVRDVKETMLPVPPLQEQERIAKILSSVDNAVAEAKAVVRQMSRLRQAMIDTLALKGTCNSELCESPIGKVPAGWEVVSLKDLTEGPIRNGYSPVCPDEPTGRWILSLGALGPDGLDTHEVKPAPEGDARVNDFLLQSGDFLVSRSNTRERVGWSALFRGEVTDCAYPDLMMRFRVNLNLICPEYLEAYLYSTPALRYLQRRASGTSSSMVKINQSILRAMPVLVPPLKEQERIAKHFHRMRTARSRAVRALKKVQRLKKGLVEDLLAGRSQVTPESKACLD